MATRTFRLVFEWTVSEPGEGALPGVKEVRNVVEGCCPEAMVGAIQDFIDDEDTGMSKGAGDAIVLVSVEQVVPVAPEDNEPPMTLGEFVMFGERPAPLADADRRDGRVGDERMGSERPAVQPAFEIVYRVDLVGGLAAGMAAESIRAAADASGAEDALANALWVNGGPGESVEHGRVVLDRVTAVPRG